MRKTLLILNDQKKQQQLNAIATIPLQHPLLDGLQTDLLRKMSHNSGPKKWYLNLASVPSNRRAQAQALVDALTQQGHQAFMRKKDNIAKISVGPFLHQDSHTESALRRFPSPRPGSSDEIPAARNTGEHYPARRFLAAVAEVTGAEILQPGHLHQQFIASEKPQNALAKSGKTAWDELRSANNPWTDRSVFTLRADPHGDAG